MFRGPGAIVRESQIHSSTSTSTSHTDVLVLVLLRI